jgi:hypothetical protein
VTSRIPVSVAITVHLPSRNSIPSRLS